MTFKRVTLCLLTILMISSGTHAKVVINEFLTQNISLQTDPQGEHEDWIELYNRSRRAVDLAGLYLTDDFSNLTKWQFPLNYPALTTIKAQGYLILWADGDTDQPGLHTSFKLSAAGEEIALVDVNGTVLDQVQFAEQLPNTAYGRDALDPERWEIMVLPTPGNANLPGYLGTVEKPVFDRQRGFYDRTFSLELTCGTPDATILYTTNGEDPYSTARSQTYSGPIRITKTACIRAVAVKPGFVHSATVSHTYLMNISTAIKSLPVLSLVGSPGETFYAPDGIMAIVGGRYNNGVWSKSTTDSYNNVLEHGLERPVSLEYLSTDSNTFQVDCGIRVHGSSWMRPRYTTSSKFSFRLYFRNQYGPDMLRYPLLPFEVDEFKSLVLRGGHNDRTNPFIKDELTRRLLKDMGHVSSGGTITTVFINGQYEGYFNPCEHIAEAFCQSWFDSELDWDIITMSGDAREGDRVRIEALKQFIRTHDLSQPENYRVVERQVDIKEFIDYLILRLWTGDWDWPHNNWSAASERSSQGKWHFFVWDSEGGMFSDRLHTVFFDRLHTGSHENTVLYDGLHASPYFRAQFGDRVSRHFFKDGALTAPHITRRFRELQQQMNAILPNMNTCVVDTWVPQRRDIFLDACKKEGVYTFEGPLPYVNIGEQQGGYFQSGDRLFLINSGAAGTVYYTTNGEDPATMVNVSTSHLPTLAARGADKYVLVPTGDLGLAWTDMAYDDSSWQQVTDLPGGIGYERDSGYDINIGLDVEAAMRANSSCYIRIPFTVSSRIRRDAVLTLRIQYDDGFVAYINGQEVARRNATGTPSWKSNASADHADTAAVVFESIELNGAGSVLKNGANVLSIHGLNRSTDSSDFLINAELLLGKSDPIEVGETLHVFDAPITLTEATRIKARALDTDMWSSLTEVTFVPKSVIEGLRISEIMYHPLDTGNPQDPNTEFIELKNTSDQTINLAMVAFTDGIRFEFNARDLAPNNIILVVKDRVAFEQAYGPDLPVAGEYLGSLNNGGERIELLDGAGNPLHRFDYQDTWYSKTDGDGFSLTVIQPELTEPETLSDQSLWMPSSVRGGTPGWE